jgi:hypothetical protein
MSYPSHDALRQCLGITDVSPVGTIRDRRIPNTLPSCGSRREPPVRAVFFALRKNLEHAAGGHRYRFGLPDDEVIQHSHSDQPQRMSQFAGDGLIGGTRLGDATDRVRVSYAAVDTRKISRKQCDRRTVDVHAPDG